MVKHSMFNHADLCNMRLSRRYVGCEGSGVGSRYHVAIL